MQEVVAVKRVIVLGAQVPFVRGGAEFLNEELVRQINLWGKKNARLSRNWYSCLIGGIRKRKSSRPRLRGGYWI